MDSADIEKCIKMIDDSVVKSSLKKATEDALEYGVCIKFLKIFRHNKTELKTVIISFK